MKFFSGNNNFKVINNFCLSITKFGLIPILVTRTLFAKIFLFVSNMLDLKLSFLNNFIIWGFFSKLNKITLDEKIIAITKNKKNINAILSNEILRLDLFSS